MNEKNKLQIINDVLKGLLDLQQIYFDDELKFNDITSVLLQFSAIIRDDVKKGELNG